MEHLTTDAYRYDSKMPGATAFATDVCRHADLCRDHGAKVRFGKSSARQRTRTTRPGQNSDTFCVSITELTLDYAISKIGQLSLMIDEWAFLAQLESSNMDELSQVLHRPAWTKSESRNYFRRQAASEIAQCLSSYAEQLKRSLFNP